MPSSTRLGDPGSGHRGHAAAPSVAGSPDVNIDGIPAVRQGDGYAGDDCVLSGGSASVFVNGRPAGRVGDALSCGGQAQAGSETVFIGD